MKTKINIDNKEIVFQRNWFTGSFTDTNDGIKKKLDKVLYFSTHFSIKLSKKHKLITENIRWT